MNKLNQQIIKTIAIGLSAIAAAAAVTSAQAAWFDPTIGMYVGNVCQTPIGWQIVRPAVVGASCFSPAFGVGVITN